MPSYFPVSSLLSASYFRTTLTVEQGKRFSTGFLVVMVGSLSIVVGSLVVVIVAGVVAMKVGSAMISKRCLTNKPIHNI